MSSLIKSEKRRGRPSKIIKQVSISKTKKVEKKQEEEQLVLFLPSYDDEQSNEKSDQKKIIKKEVETTENNFTSFDSSENDSATNMSEKLEYLSEQKYDKNKMNLEKLLEEIHKRDSMINALKSKLKDKSIFNENILTLTKENKKQLINLNLISINNNKINICEKTHIACWWCTYNFDSQPLFLPNNYKNNIYYVFGNFCTFSCMLSYNENMDDYRKNVRNVLIKQLYREIFNCDDMNIKAAGQRELLEKFGGPMSITKFRDSHIVSRKTFKITIPPQIPLISDVEEIVLDKK
jgi:hypothetical protein